MEPAGRVLGKTKLSGQIVSDEQVVKSAWARAVGKKIAARSKAVGLVRSRVIVEVEDAVWQSQLFTLRHQILKRLEQLLGRTIATEMEFRVAIPKRGPQREEEQRPALITYDEADAIRDPLLRSIYKASRRRAATA